MKEDKENIDKLDRIWSFVSANKETVSSALNEIASRFSDTPQERCLVRVATAMTSSIDAAIDGDMPLDVLESIFNAALSITRNSNQRQTLN